MSENPNLPVNSGEPDCETLQSLLPAYSIGATDEQETRLVEELLPLCPEFADELQEYVALSGAMLQTVTPAMPSASLHDKLMAATAATAAPATLVKPEPKSSPAPIIAPSRFWIGAAAALLVLLLISNAYWAMVTSQIRQTQDDLIVQIQQQGELVTNLTSGNLAQFNLSASTGNARVFWNSQRRVAILSTDGLPPLSGDQTYQLWLITGENPISAGIFQVDANGRALLIFNPEMAIGEYDAVGISTEPAGGSEAPTTTPIAVGEV